MQAPNAFVAFILYPQLPCSVFAAKSHLNSNTKFPLLIGVGGDANSVTLKDFGQ